MVDRKAPPTRPAPVRDPRNDAIEYSEGKRNGLNVSPTRPAPARKPDKGQDENEG
ncbi:hypothetical protein [Roseovarius sp. MBR-6]|jgi:hypothetical protein|uniref:hypothetical protein n=1 Tax=Roseovarius sp. MBR-6 TaxID=3156459 RepID=UPI00339405F8